MSLLDEEQEHDRVVQQEMEDLVKQITGDVLFIYTDPSGAYYFGGNTGFGDFTIRPVQQPYKIDAINHLMKQGDLVKGKQRYVYEVGMHLTRMHHISQSRRQQAKPGAPSP